VQTYFLALVSARIFVSSSGRQGKCILECYHRSTFFRKLEKKGMVCLSPEKKKEPWQPANHGLSFPLPPSEKEEHIKTKTSGLGDLLS